MFPIFVTFCIRRKGWWIPKTLMPRSFEYRLFFKLKIVMFRFGWLASWRILSSVCWKEGPGGVVLDWEPSCWVLGVCSGALCGGKDCPLAHLAVRFVESVGSTQTPVSVHYERPFAAVDRQRSSGCLYLCRTLPHDQASAFSMSQPRHGWKDPRKEQEQCRGASECSECVRAFVNSLPWRETVRPGARTRTKNQTMACTTTEDAHATHFFQNIWGKLSKNPESKPRSYRSIL